MMLGVGVEVVWIRIVCCVFRIDIGIAVGIVFKLGFGRSLRRGVTVGEPFVWSSSNYAEDEIYC